MVAIWPDGLPRHFNRKGYSRQPGEGRRRTATTTGPGKTRLLSRAVPHPMSGQMEMTGAQLDLFWAFFDVDLARGAKSFVFPDPRGRLPILVQFGEGLPRETPLAGDRWLVDLPLEQLHTGSFEPGLPPLAPGAAYLTHGGAYVLLDGRPIVVPAP